MASFQRMVVIPQEEYTQLTSVQNARQPLTQQFYKLDNQYRDYDSTEDEYRKLMLQSETLQDMKELKDKMRNYLTVTTPKPYRSRAQALFESMQQFLKYNDRGELLDADNKAIENSRVEDLIQHAVRDRRRLGMPTGWPNFVQMLKTHNIPRSFLNRDTLDEMTKTSPTAISHKSRIPVLEVKVERKSRKDLRRRTDKVMHSKEFAYSKERPKRLRKKSQRYPSAEFLKNF